MTALETAAVGLSDAAKVDAFLADALGAHYRRAVRRLLRDEPTARMPFGEARARRDVREQFVARLEAI